MREKWIDNAKGIAIILVILAHVNNTWGFAYGFHLVVFFLISGYTFKKREGFLDFARKKFRKLMIPYFYTCLAVLVTDIVNSYLISNNSSIGTVTEIIGRDLTRSFFASGSITNFGSIEIGTRIGAIWFLPALFFSLTVFRIISDFIKRDCFLGISSVLIAVIGYITAQFIWFPFSIQSGMFATPFVFIGYIIKKKNVLDAIKIWQYFVSLIVLLVGIKLGFCSISFVKASIVDFIISPAVGIAGSMLVYSLSKCFRGNVLETIGKMSMTIMCVHLYSLETMGNYINGLVDGIGVTGYIRSVCICIIYVSFAIVVAYIIEKAIIDYMRKKNYMKISNSNGRDRGVDVAKGIFIIAMVFAHYPINSTLRSIVFSCHMIAFVILSGYCYKAKGTIIVSIKRMIKTFILPYGIAFLIVVLISYKAWSPFFFKDILVKYVLGLSFSKKFFLDIGSVGPIYFILLLFLIRVMYLVIDIIKCHEYMKWGIVLLISVIGVYCGKKGYWLPWSFDVACYCLVFYKVGVFVKEKDLISKFTENAFVYFLISPIWVFMIYSGSMEIAIRNYGNYGLVVAGAISGVMITHMLSKYIDNNLRIVSSFLSLCGQCSIYILIVHTTLCAVIGKLLVNWFNETGVMYVAIGVALQISVALIANIIVKYAKIVMNKNNYVVKI